MTALRSHSLISRLTGLVLFFSTPLIFAYSQSETAGVASLLSSYQYWLFILYYTAIYFLLNNILVPRLYEKRKYGIAIAVTLILVALTIFVKPFDRLMHRQLPLNIENKFNEFRPPPPGENIIDFSKQHFPTPNRNRGPAFDFVSIFLLVMLILLVVATESVRKWRITEQRAIRAEADKANAELSFLKAQINPHFLFNTLNNIYSLAVNKSERTADAVIKLSNIMRYVTDDVNETTVPLENEIDCIKNYTSLQQLRLGDNVKINFEVEGALLNKEIPPLVLMTFIENAFKHGISNHEPCEVNIKIVTQQNFIHFSVQNKLMLKPRNIERTGIGIENTKKRLLALYPDKHLLEINETGGLYSVQLILYN